MPALNDIGQEDHIRLLSATVPDSIGPGPVEILMNLPEQSEEDEAMEWMRGIAHEWRDELEDVRQDIYALSDGEPVDVPG